MGKAENACILKSPSVGKVIKHVQYVTYTNNNKATAELFPMYLTVPFSSAPATVLIVHRYNNENVDAFFIMTQ